MKKSKLEKSDKQLRVLIVDSMADSLESYVKITNALLQLGLKVNIVGSGAEALDYLHWIQSPCLMIIDIILPDMSGFELATKIRRERSVPIVMTGLQTDTHTVAGLLDLVADDFIRKPFDARELAARVRRLLQRTNQAAQPPRKVSKARSVRLILHHELIKSM